MPAATLEVLILGDSAPLSASLASASAETRAFAATTEKSLTSIGSTSRKVFGALGFATAAVAIGTFAKDSVQAALDYENSFVKIDAITNATSADIENMGSSIMALSHQTAVAPTELAHAMYYLASAGLTTTQQMESLDAVAKGTAVGLGDSADLAKILTQALNVFGDSGLRAVDVMDTITAAVREGSAEPDEFAAAMGRVLPIADKAGISFQQVAASLATMSNAGLKVNIGATALRGLLQALVAPTHQSMEALQTLGLSVDDVVNSLAQHGLIDTLRMLDKAAKQNTNSTGQYNIVMRNLIPNIRALTGAFNLTTQDAGKVDQIFQAVANSGGDLAEAFSVVEKSTPFKFKQALNDLGVAGQNLAVNVLPPLAKLLQLVADHTGFFFTALAAFAALKWVAPLWQSDAAAAAELAGAEQAAALGARELATAQAESAAGANASAIGGMNAQIRQQLGLTSAVSGTTAALGRAADAQSTFVAETASGEAAFVRFNLLAGQAKLPITQLASAGTGFSASAAQLGNTLESSSIPQILALADAAQRAYDEVSAFKTSGFTGALKASQSQGFASPEAQFVIGPTATQGIQGFLNAFNKPDLTGFNDALTTIQAGFAETGVSASDAQGIIDKALQDIGGSLNTQDPTQVAAFVDAVNKEQSAFQQARDASELLIKEQMLADQSTQRWQNSTIKAGNAIKGLGALTGDANGYLINLRSTLEQSTNPAQDYAAAVADLGAKWRDFQAQTASQINFLPQGLADITSQAEQAKSSLADALANPPDAHASAQTIRDYNANLADLRSQADLTGQEILTSFRQSTAQIKTFSQNLLEISHVGGKAGKDLANSLLQSGNVLAAQIIADAPAKLQNQIVTAFGKGQSAADEWSTKLTNAIVGPLKKIVQGLKVIVEKTWGIDLNGKAVDDTKGKTKDLTHDLEHLSSTKYRVNMEDGSVVNAKTQVANLNQSLKNLPAKTVLDIKLHTHGGSPLPDEVMKRHLWDPMKRNGFKQINGLWTMPANVVAHTDLHGSDGGGKNGSKTTGGGKGDASVPILKHIEATQLRILAVEKAQNDFLRTISRGGGTGGGSSSSSSGTSSGGTSSGGSSSDSTGFTGSLGRMMHRFENAIKEIQGPVYARRWAKEMANQINKPGGSQMQTLLLKQLMRDIAKATNPAEAHKAADQFRKAIHDWEDAIKKQNQEQRQQFMQDALDYAAKHAPRLPQGHTRHFDQRRHHHKAEVTLDRKRFTDSASYDIDYARGF